MSRPAMTWALVLGIITLSGGCGGARAGSPAAPATCPCKRAAPAPSAASAAEAPNDDSIGLPKAEIQATIRTRLAEVQACYETRLRRRADLAGTVTVVFRIGSDGAVETANASGIEDAPLTTCIGDVIRTLRFSPPRGTAFVNVTYPFTFRTQP